MNYPEKSPSFFHAFICLFFTIVIIFSGLFIVHTNMQGMMIVCIFWVLINTYIIDKDLHRLKSCLTASIKKSSSILLIYIFIGTIIGVFIISGAIPTLIYYGLKLITPTLFLPAGLLLCSMMSLALGSCWATIGTMGIALMGVAAILDIPLAITAGMIVSGAYFGDKLSPISDTTILSAHVTGTDLHKHIKGMTYSLIPAYLFTLFLFWVIGMFYLPMQTLQATYLSDVFLYLASHYHIGFIPLIPMGVMFGLSVTGKPAEFSMLIGIFLSVAVAILVQHQSIQTSLDALYVGSVIKHTDLAIIEHILNRGGMERMLSSLSLTLLILALGGLLESYQFITVLFSKLLNQFKSAPALVSITLLMSMISNMLISEAYLSIILMNKIFGKIYKKNKLDSCLLSKAIEEGATFTTPLIPWTTSGIFITSTLGISPIDYLPWSLLNWIAPLFFILFVACRFFGVKMFVLSPKIVGEPLCISI